MKTPVCILALLAAQCCRLPAATPLKDLVALEGARDNQLIGYGLVVGLAGTGDRRQTVFSAQSLTNMLERMGLSVSPTAIQVKNTAAVMVTATLPPYALPGAQIDVTVAAIGDASNIQGGILLMTGLKGPDSQVYAMAQGAAVLGGYSAGGAANKQVVNHPTVGRIPNGAIVERPSPSPKLGPSVRLQLRRGDFTTAMRIADSVNEHFGEVARAENAGLVSVAVPAKFQNNPVAFVSQLERLPIEPGRSDRIVINERTGTVVMGRDVVIAPVAILHGNLSVEVQTALTVSQPNPMAGGTTEVVPQVNVAAKEAAAKNVILKDGATVEELVRALAAIGSTPRDIIAILQNLKSAGAILAELEVI